MPALAVLLLLPPNYFKNQSAEAARSPILALRLQSPSYFPISKLIIYKREPYHIPALIFHL